MVVVYLAQSVLGSHSVLEVKKVNDVPQICSGVVIYLLILCIYVCLLFLPFLTLEPILL